MFKKQTFRLISYSLRAYPARSALSLAKGEVYLDSWPLVDLDLVAWRRMIGYVPQETLLFHNMIHRNITLGDEEISRDAVTAALDQAGSAEFVNRLPEGMDRVVGERGSRVPGGQRQRLSNARALVRNPELLVLDEVTTALGPVREAAICTNLHGLSGSVTILSISHQPAMMKVADLICEVKDGQVTRSKSGAPVQAARG